MDFTYIKNWLNEHLGDSTFVFEVFLIVFFTMLTNFIWRRVHAKIYRQFQKTKNNWDDAVIKSLSKPVVLLIWGIGCWIIINFQFGYQLQSTYRDVGLVFIVSWFLVRFIREAEINLLSSNIDKPREDKIDQSTIEAISKLLRVSVR